MTNAAARQARDAGIQLAESHANATVPNWSDRAYGLLLDFLAISPRIRGTTLTSEQFRGFAASCGLPKPPHLRAYGAVFQRAARAGLIQKVGITTSSAAHCHCSHVGEWRAS